MEQVRIHGPGDARPDDVAEPEAGARDVVLKVAACGVCGTDLHYMERGGVIGPGPERVSVMTLISGPRSFAKILVATQ